jgi:hypothetical protein
MESTIGLSRPRSSSTRSPPDGPGSAVRRWRRPPPPGCTGTTRPDCTPPSATSHRSSTRRPTTTAPPAHPRATLRPLWPNHTLRPVQGGSSWSTPRHRPRGGVRSRGCPALRPSRSGGLRHPGLLPHVPHCGPPRAQPRELRVSTKFLSRRDSPRPPRCRRNPEQHEQSEHRCGERAVRAACRAPLSAWWGPVVRAVPRIPCVASAAGGERPRQAKGRVQRRANAPGPVHGEASITRESAGALG